MSLSLSLQKQLNKKLRVRSETVKHLNEEKKVFQEQFHTLKSTALATTNQQNLLKHQLHWKQHCQTYNQQYKQLHHDIENTIQTLISSVSYSENNDDDNDLLQCIDTEYHNSINEFTTYQNELIHQIATCKQYAQDIKGYQHHNNNEYPHKIKEYQAYILTVKEENDIVNSYHTKCMNTIEQELQLYDNKWLEPILDSDHDHGHSEATQHTNANDSIDPIEDAVKQKIIPTLSYTQLQYVYTQRHHQYTVYQQQCASIDQKYRQRLEELKNTYHTQIEALVEKLYPHRKQEQQGNNHETNIALHEWTNDEYQRLTLIIQQYLSTNESRSLLLNRLAYEFPSPASAASSNLSKELEIHVDSFIAEKYYQQKHSTLIQQWKHEYTQYEQHYYTHDVPALDQKLLEYLKKQEQENLRQEAARIRKSTLQEIQRYREQKAEKQRIEEEEKLKLIKEYEAKQEMLRQKHCELQAKRFDEWRYERYLDELRQHEMREKQEQEDARLQQEQHAYNAQRVNYRLDEYHRKQEEREKLKEQEREEEKEKERVINNLIASVAPHVESDPTRVLQPILANTYDNDHVINPLWSQRTGYSVDELLKDDRLRVDLALREHGIDMKKNEYARMMVQAQQPATTYRRDMISNVKLRDGSTN